LAPVWAFIGVYMVSLVISIAHASSMIHLFSGPYGY
jgi:hypothetical protein